MRQFFIPFATALVLAFSCEKVTQEVDDTVMVADVSINQSSVDLVIGETIQLSATIKPSDATDQNLIWSSANKEVATVSNNGLVTAVSEGRTAIMVKVGGKTSICVVTVSKEYVAVTSITLDKNSLSLTKGESKNLVATVTPTEATYKALSWTSSAPEIASVDSNGKVTAIAIGSATITVKANDKQATCDVTVTVPLVSISLNKSELTLTKGQSETLIATIKPEDATDNTISWSSSNNTVATVDSDGTVSAVGGGQATITAKAGNKKASCVLTVIVPVESVTLKRNSITLGEGESTTLSVTITPKDATEDIMWSSSDESIVAVDQYGKINAIKEGTANIVVKAGDKQATCVVTVIKRVESVSLDMNAITLFVGNSAILSATVLPEDATDRTITWKSYDTNVATVDNGVVKGIGIGRTTITASAGNITATCAVEVVIDSANGVSARFYGGNYETINNMVQPGGELLYGVINFSSETIHVVSAQLIDGQTGIGNDVLSIDSEVISGAYERWIIPVSTAVFSPIARFTYTFKGEAYTCEAIITPL